MTKITLYNLTKISLNQWYAGKHWSKRKTIKDNYKMLIPKKYHNAFKGVFNVKYTFYFNSNPLDATNTIAMVKMIEDIIFLKDGYKDILSVTVESKKGDERVEIDIN